MTTLRQQVGANGTPVRVEDVHGLTTQANAESVGLWPSHRIVLWDGALVWAAGTDRVANAIDDYDWEALRGGGFVALDPTDGRVRVSGRFSEELAWGTGGVPLALVPGRLCGIGRRGELYTFDTRDGAPLSTSAPIADDSLGIAHAAAAGDRILYGFNRGGYRLHAIRSAVVSRGGSS